MWTSLFAYAGDIEDAEAAYKRRDYSTALKLLRPLATQGLPRAQYRLGIMTFKGEGVSLNQSEGVALVRPAAVAGIAEAQAFLAYLSFLGTVLPKDYAVGIQWAEKAAVQDEPISQLLIATANLRGTGIPINFEVASQWLRKSAAQGNPMAQYELGKLYLLGLGVKADESEGVRLVQEGSEKHPAVSENAKIVLDARRDLRNWRDGLARLVCGSSCVWGWAENRRKIQKHIENAEWTEVAARVLWLGFQSDLSYYYLGRASEGIGDLPAALTYYKLALDPKLRGHVCAGLFNNCDGLVFPKDATDRLNSVTLALLENRIAEEKKRELEVGIRAAAIKESKLAEEQTAFNVAKQSADAGDVDSQYRVARMFFGGSGTDVNPQLGFVWLGKAAEGGSPLAQYDLGERYRTGLGVEVDLVNAELWLSKSIKQGHPDSSGGYAILLAEKKQRLGEQVSASVAFNTKAEFLPKGLKGVDVKGAISRFLRIPFPEKTEFETVSDFRATVANWERKIEAEQSINGLQAFIKNGFEETRTDSDAILKYKGYDIEKQLMSLNVSYIKYYGQIFQDASSFDGSYVGSNAFGASVRVERWSHTRYAVEFPSDSDRLIGPRSLTVSVDKEIAQRISKNLTYVLIGKMLPPFAKLDESSREPKIDNPYKVRERNYSLTVDPIAFWLVDPLTGKVLLKVDVARKK